MRARARAILLTGLTACAAPLPPTPAPDDLPPAPVEVPLSPYFRQLRTVRATTAAGDSLSLLLDTGGGSTLLTVQAAERLGCRPFGRQTGYRMSGERVDFQWCGEVPLSLGGVRLAQPVVAVYDLMALLPEGLPPLDGVLSLRSFEDRVLTVDLGGGRLVMESDSSTSRRATGGRPLQARVATGEDGGMLTVFLAVRGERGPLWLLLDSGNLVGTLLAPHAARQLGIPADSGAVTARIEVLGLPAADGPVFVRELILDGALGAAFMEQGPLTLDLRHGRVRVYLGGR